MRIALFFLFLLFSTQLLSQQFGGHPPGQRWDQLKTPNAFVLFPKGWDSSARRIAGLMEKIYQVTDSSSTKLKKPVPIILQHQTTISNGYVALAPFRSEWNMTAPVNSFELGSIPWPDQLGLHEQRHMQQYQQFNRGGARVFRWILGEQGQALANALTVPDWFFEGDAVYQETFLSDQGRGRMPSFYNGYRSIWEAGKNYSYQKLRNGSYREYVPTHYQLGYLLVSQGKELYGPLFWKNVTNDAASMKGIFYPFQKAVKKYSGQGFADFRESAIRRSRQNLIDSTAIQVKEFQPVIDEENPVYTEKGELLFMRSSYKELPAFYWRKKSGEVQKIRVRDRSLDNYFSYTNGKIIYASYQPDTRWNWKDYSTLQVLDIETGKQQTITRKSKYFHPALSGTGDSIVTIQLDAMGKSRFHLLSSNGEFLKEIKNDSNYIYSFPAFSGKKILTASRNRKGEMSIQLIEIESGLHQNILPWTNHIIGYPKSVGDSIIFTISINGLDQSMLYYNGQLGQFSPSHSQTGQYQPVVVNNQITSMQFTAHGYKLRTDSLEIKKWTAADSLLTTPIFPMESPVYSDQQGSITDQITAVDEPVKSWSQIRQLFKFHSWTPWFEEPEISLTVHSQNLLNSFQSNLTATYNRNEGFKQVSFNAVYGGLLTYLRGGIDYTFDRKGLFRNNIVRWNELELSGGLQIPLNLSKGRQLSFLNASTDLVYNQPYFRLPEKDTLGNLSFSYLNYQVQYSIQTQQARQHINPRWASSVRLQLRSTINRYSSRQWLAAFNHYLPGFSTNHSLVLGWAIGGRDSLSGIRFSNNFPFARGYEAIGTYRSQKIGLTYHFPVAYPDAGFGNIVYLLRIRAAGFFDWAQAKDERILRNTQWLDFRSIGMEWNFDTRWWNQLPVSFGIRYAYLLDSDRMGGLGSSRWQLILPINLIPAGAARLQQNKRLHF